MEQKFRLGEVAASGPCIRPVGRVRINKNRPCTSSRCGRRIRRRCEVMQVRKHLSQAQVAKVSADKRLVIVPLQVKLQESRFRSRLPKMSAEKMASSVTVPLSPEDFREKLNRLLHDAGFQEPDLVAVQSAPFGGHARYVVSVVAGKPRFALANALEGMLHRPLVGDYWVLHLAEVEMVSAAARQ